MGSALGNGISAMLQDAAIDRAFAKVEREAHANAAEWSRAYNQMQFRALTAETQLFGMTALHGAMSACLLKSDYQHPLVADNGLRQNVFDVGVHKGRADTPYDLNVVNRAGKQFLVPASVNEINDRPRKLAERVADAERKYVAQLGKTSAANHENNQLKARIASLEAAALSSASAVTGLQSVVAEREETIRSIREEHEKNNPSVWKLIEDCAAHMALHYAHREALRSVDANHVLLRGPTIKGRISREAFQRLMADSNPNWELVREVGMTWNMPKSGDLISEAARLEALDLLSEDDLPDDVRIAADANGADVGSDPASEPHGDEERPQLEGHIAEHAVDSNVHHESDIEQTELSHAHV